MSKLYKVIINWQHKDLGYGKNELYFNVDKLRLTLKEITDDEVKTVTDRIIE